MKKSDEGDDGQRRSANKRRSDRKCQAIGLVCQSYVCKRNSRSSFLGETLPLDQRSKTHISSEMARELIAIYQTMYHLWFLVYQRVLPQLHVHLLLHYLHHRIPKMMSTDTPKIQYQKEVEVRVKSFGETRCMNPQKPKTKIKMMNAKKYKDIYRMSCLIGYRNSERIWSMEVLQQSLGETQSKEVKTHPSHLMNFQWSREQKWNRVREGSVYTHFPKNPKL